MFWDCGFGYFGVSLGYLICVVICYVLALSGGCCFETVCLGCFRLCFVLWDCWLMVWCCVLFWGGGLCLRCCWLFILLTVWMSCLACFVFVVCWLCLIAGVCFGIFVWCSLDLVVWVGFAFDVG